MDLQPSRSDYKWVSVEPMHRAPNKKSNRLERIMDIKVVKPKVGSTLAAYQPTVKKRTETQSAHNNKHRQGQMEWFECLRKEKEKNCMDNEWLLQREQQRNKTKEYEAQQQRDKR